MYILNVRKGSSGLLFEVTKCHFEGPIRVLLAEATGLTRMPNCLPDTGQKAKKSRELSNSTRKAIVVAIAEQCENGKPRHGVFQKVARTVGVHRATVTRLWKKYGNMTASQAISMPAAKFSSRGERGRPRVYSTEDLVEHVKSIPVSQRRTVSRNERTKRKRSRFCSR